MSTAVRIHADVPAATVPECAVCNKAVDAFIRDGKADAAGDVGFVALCHGQREEVRVPRKLVLGSSRITLGKAFAKTLPSDDVVVDGFTVPACQADAMRRFLAGATCRLGEADLESEVD